MENGLSVINPQERMLKRTCMKISPFTWSYRGSLFSTSSTSLCPASSPAFWLYLSFTCLLEQVSMFGISLWLSERDHMSDAVESTDSLCQHEKEASRVKNAAWLSYLLTVCRWEDDSLHFCPHRSDCLHASAGWQSPWDFPGHSNHRQLRHVHHDPGHLLCHPKCCRTQLAPQDSKHAHHATLGSTGQVAYLSKPARCPTYCL